MMKELGMALLGSFAIFGFFGFKIYPDLEYTGYSSVGNCTGQCYAEYVELNGTAVEIEQRKQALAQSDEFSSIEVYGQVVPTSWSRWRWRNRTNVSRTKSRRHN